MDVNTGILNKGAALKVNLIEEEISGIIF